MFGFQEPLHESKRALREFQLPLQEKEKPLQRFQEPLLEKNCHCIAGKDTANVADDQKVMRYDLLVMKRSSYPLLRNAKY